MPQYKSGNPTSSRPEAADEQAGTIRASRTAIVVVDMINHQLTPGRCFLSAMEAAGMSTDYITDRVENTVVPNLQRLLRVARQSGCLVVFVRVGSADGSFNDTNPNVRPMMESWDARDGEWACDVIDALRPEPTDLSLMKSSSGAFTAAALHSQLQEAAIENLVSVGVITDGCVLLTAAAGFDLGYHGIVVADCTATFSPDLQASAEQLIGNFMAKVLTTDQFIDALN